jgi:hypothetical protein
MLFPLLIGHEVGDLPVDIELCSILTVILYEYYLDASSCARILILRKLVVLLDWL